MEKKKLLLNRIARFLMLHSSSINNIGLLNGKLGVCIFFYRYAEYIQKNYYAEFAGELIDEIYDQIHDGYRRDFKNGLSGICWGMEYIIRNKFVDADADEVLENLDMQVLERDVRRIYDISLETGLDGLAHYVLSRTINRENRSLFTSSYIIELIQSLQRNNGNQKLISNLKDLIEGRSVEYTFNLLDELSNNVKYKESDLFKKENWGIIENGTTGIAINILNQLTI